MTWVKCIDKDDKPNKLPPCIFAKSSDPVGVLSTKDLLFLGFIKCSINGSNYLANTPRPCSNYISQNKDEIK